MSDPKEKQPTVESEEGQIKLPLAPNACKERRIGGAKDVIRQIAEDFDEPLPDFTEYMV